MEIVLCSTIFNLLGLQYLILLALLVYWISLQKKERPLPDFSILLYSVNFSFICWESSLFCTTIFFLTSSISNSVHRKHIHFTFLPWCDLKYFIIIILQRQMQITLLFGIQRMFMKFIWRHCHSPISSILSFSDSVRSFLNHCHSIRTYSRDSLGFSVAPIPVTKYRAVPLLLTRRFCIQTVLEQYHTYYRNSSTNYLTTEMSMKQGYAFGTRIRLSEEIIKTLKMCQLSHYHLFWVKFRLITVL